MTEVATGRLWSGIGIGVVAGILLMGAARFAFAPWQHPVHFHANWAIYIDGERLDLSSQRYMEDVVACAAGDQVFPEERVHMHNGEDQVVHVHHEGVSWGHLLQNLGFAGGGDFVILDDGRTLAPDGERTLKYVLNGIAVPEITRRMIGPGDRLLISHGAEPVAEVVATQFPLVADDAPRYDAENDPSTCSGATHLHTGARLRRALWW
jgi:hypothetical protein